MAALSLSASPHIHSGNSTRRVMLDVVIALLPASVAAVLIFGMKALVVLLACTVSAVLFEALFCLLTGRKQSVGDLSAVVTGLLLGLNLSTNVPVWQCVIGSFFAIILVKCLFGGLGHNFANPAITARVFMLLAFSAVAGGANPVAVELTTSATPLELINSDMSALPSLGDMFLGLRGGAVGESCILALLIGYAYLVFRRHIKWFVPATFIGVVFVLSLVFSGDLVYSIYQIMGGGLFIGAIFMATDYVTTPITVKGKVVFAAGCGIITFVIRYFCAYPEGVSFSILAMNILTPYIEKLTAAKPLGGK